MLIEAILQRRSIRRYANRAIETQKLERVLEAARLAPTAKNRQDWRLVVVDDPACKERLFSTALAHQPFTNQAPVIIAACSLNPEYVMRCGVHAYPVDLAIVLDHLSLQATREGLGTCWLGSFDQEPARAALGIPDNVIIVQLMTLGYPLETPAPRPRKPLSILISRNGWESD